MARYTNAVCRLCRREGQKLFLKGDRCYTEKCSVDRRSYPPGEHGQGRRKASNTACSSERSKRPRDTTDLWKNSSVDILKWLPRKGTDG